MNSTTLATGVAAAAFQSTAGIAVVSVPMDMGMPWWGYILVGVINSFLGFATVWMSKYESRELRRELREEKAMRNMLMKQNGLKGIEETDEAA